MTTLVCVAIAYVLGGLTLRWWLKPLRSVSCLFGHHGEVQPASKYAEWSSDQLICLRCFERFDVEFKERS